MGRTQARISFQVGSVLSYDVADIRSLRFESEAQGASPSGASKQPSVPSSIEKEKNEVAKSSSWSPFLRVHGFRFAPSIPLQEMKAEIH